MKKIIIFIVVMVFLLTTVASAGWFNQITGMPVFGSCGDGICNWKENILNACPADCDEIVELPEEVEEENECIDTDGGIVLDSYGTTTGNYGIAGVGTYSDRCLTVGPYEGMLVEYFCIGEWVQFHRFDCPNGMECNSGECVTEAGEVIIAEGVNGQVALGEALTSVFDFDLEDDELSVLFDGEITFQGQSYDTSEVLQLEAYPNSNSRPIIATSITSSEDDYESNVVLEVPGRDAIKYFYKFDETIDLEAATAAEPLEIEILGMNFVITNIGNAESFTADYSGQYDMEETDTMWFNGKFIEIIAVGGSSIVIEVDGTTEIINSGNTQIVNGVEITVDNLNGAVATITLGAVSETFDDGDPFVTEPTDGTADWIWNFEHLDAVGLTKILSVENDFVWNDFDDNPAMPGECLGLPNDYVEICFDELTVEDTDYGTYTAEMDQDLDASMTFAGLTSLDAIYIHTDVSEGISLPIYEGGIINNSFTVTTADVWLYYDEDATTAINGSTWGGGTSWLDVFYKDPSQPNVVRWHGSVRADYARDIFHVEYGDTTSTDVELRTEGVDTNELFLQYNMLPANLSNAENLTMTWGISGVVVGLGYTPNLEESSELVLNRAYDSDPFLGTKDEDHRLAYGVVLKNPTEHGSSDEVELEVPNDQVFAQVTIM